MATQFDYVNERPVLSEPAEDSYLWTGGLEELIKYTRSDNFKDVMPAGQEGDAC